MNYQKSLQNCLGDITLGATVLLEYLKQSPLAGFDQNGMPADPFHGAPKTVEDSRKQVMNAAAKAVQLATRPSEYLDHLANGYQNLACVRWLINQDIVGHIPSHGTITYQDLAVAAGVPSTQLKSVARMAICHGFLEEPTPSNVAHSRISALYAQDQSFMSWARWMVNYSVPTAFKLSEATDLWGETDAKDQTAFNLGLGVPVPFFDHLRKTPEMTNAFAGYMRNVTSSAAWSLDHAVTGFDWAALPDGAKVVDMGGSHGQLAVQVAQAFPHLQFIIQDLPETVEIAQKAFDSDTTISSSVKDRIQFMPHDFFSPQPVKDAHIYFLRMIIHDWPDKDALIILRHLQDTLISNSNGRIVIMDTVLPQPGSTEILLERQLRVRDLTMMQVFNSKERELEDWHNLAETADLRVSHIQQPRDSVMGIITMQLTESGDAPGGTEIIDPEQPGPRYDSGCEETLPLNDDAYPVLIMGAGIGGLCLAQALQKAGVPFQVFERDPAVDSRKQGYRLKLEADGARALSDSLPSPIYDDFVLSCAITAVGETDYNPFSAQITNSRVGGGLSGTLGLHPSFTVDRTAFRSSLMNEIGDKIFFGKELSRYSVDANKRIVTAQFKDGSTAKGRFLVGADGLSSEVRRQHLPNHKLVDTGAVCIYGKTTLTPELIQRFPEKAMRWMTVISDVAPMLQSCLIGNTPVTVLLEPIRFRPDSRERYQLPPDYLYWALIGPAQRFGAYDTAEQKRRLKQDEAAYQAARLTQEVTSEWHPSLRSLFELQDPNQATCIRVASTVPEIPEWEASPFVTVIGDAVHPMSPCGGVGANTALCDAASLGKLLKVSKGSPTAERVEAFELEMRARAFKSVIRSEIGSKRMFGQKSLIDCAPCKWMD